MASTTTRYAFPYQDPTDPPNGATLGQNLANAVETKLGLVEDRTAVLEDLTTGKPLVKVTQGVAQSIPNNTNTAITYAATDDIDTHGYHDPVTNNTRVTPLKAGYYRVTVVYWSAASVTLNFLETFVRKNGVTTMAPVNRIAGLGAAASNTGPAIGSAQTVSISATAIVQMNGSTDYVEHGVRQGQSSGTAALNTNSTGNAFSCTMEVEYLRP